MHSILKRIIDITYEQKISHLSSSLSAWPIIHEIYDHKKDDEIFILSSGHAGLALYCEIEHRTGIDAVSLLKKHSIHPKRDVENGIWCSTGSLGSGITIAVGHALADRSKNVYCLITDGEAAEGCVWESLRFIHANKLDNMHVYVNVNGQSAYEYLDNEYLINRLKAFLPRINIRTSDAPSWSFAKGLLTHYYVLKQEDYEEICESY